MRKLLIVFVTLMLCSGAYARKMYKSEKNINYNDLHTLFIGVSSGDVNVIPENRDDINVFLESSDKKLKLIISEGRDLKIETKKEGFSLFRYRPHKTKLTVRVPKEFNRKIEIKVSSGNVKINDFNLDYLKISLSSGNLIANSISAAETEVISSSGNTDFYDSNIDYLELDSSSGDIHLNNFKGEVKGDSSSGNVKIILNKLIGDINFELSSGNLNLTLPDEEIDSSFKITTNSGNIDFNFPITVEGQIKEKSLKGTVGAGRYNIDLHTSSGNITLKK